VSSCSPCSSCVRPIVSCSRTTAAWSRCSEMLRSGGYAVLFGMNFGWLTAHIGSAAAFVLLGIVLPLALVIATLIGARWLTRE